MLVVSCGVDGAPPTQGLTLQNFRKDAPPGPEIALVALPGRPGVYDAPGAVDGYYRMKLPDGWGHLISDRLPYLQPGGNPARFVVGRAHTLYAASHVHGRALGDEWGVRRIEPSGGLGVALAVQVLQDVDMGLTLLRFRPEDWPGSLAYQSRFLDGGLTEVVLTSFKDTPQPVYRELEAEPLGPMRVTVVSAEPLPDDALWVHLTVEGLPLVERQQRPVRGGKADFPGVPMGGSAVVVRVGDGDDAPAHRLLPGSWIAQGELRVLAPPAPAGHATPDVRGHAERVHLAWEGDATGLRVQARPAGGDSYGVVPVRVRPGGAEFLLPHGEWRLLVESARGAASGGIKVQEQSAKLEAQLGATVALATVQGLVHGGAGRRLVWRRLEEGRLVLAHGFVLRADGGGRFKGELPAGDYEVSVEAPDGSLGQSKRVSLEAGAHVSLPLDA